MHRDIMPELLERFRDTRARSVDLCRPLRAEDYRVQTMPDVSPPWWNLGHTTWFFAKNILEPRTGYRFPGAHFEYVLNSYYETHGKRLPRAERGLVTRPTTDEIYRFRDEVDSQMAELITDPDVADPDELGFLVSTGIQHEQQHQELLLTEVKHILGRNVGSLREAYGGRSETRATASVPAAELLPVEGGVLRFGNLEGGWCWDNESPVHKAYLEPFAVQNRLVTVGEYLEFVEAGGYEDPLLWLANGWDRVQREGWRAPLYWESENGTREIWTLAGVRPLDLDEPVCHVSFYEANAFATWKASQGGQWKGVRLPTEHEWEQAARSLGFAGEAGNLMASGVYHPLPAQGEGLIQAAGDVWEWTSSHYEPYPGYTPFDGELMEYNGKFMDNQRVLRGGSCATPPNHIRISYRNFWPAETRFQFSGIRLAKSI